MPTFKLPNDQQQLLVLGQNGSGKSVAAVWHLAQKDLENSQWVVINHKGDELIDAIPYAKHLKMDERPKKEPGVYVYHPLAGTDDAAVSELLRWVYLRGDCGVFMDEGYMFDPRDPALTALYTQGRAKHIPMITLSQRPSRISRFAVSEATFYQVFFLTDRRDRKLINEFIPVRMADLDYLMEPTVDDDGNVGPPPLPEFHSVYYNTRNHEALIVTPLPTDEAILAIFEEKLKPRGLFEFGKRRLL
jgi:hypothetical protein